MKLKKRIISIIDYAILTVVGCHYRASFMAFWKFHEIG